MSRKEVPRPGLVKLALAGQITNQQGAAERALTVRQFQRLKARYRTEGHPRPAPSPARPAVPPRPAARCAARVAALLHSVYRDVNDCHATEKLQEVQGVAISRASVRRIRRALGLPAKHRRRPRPYRRRRPPALRMGALVLLDGSQFAWLETRGPTMTLLGAIDDATGTVVALLLPARGRPPWLRHPPRPARGPPRVAPEPLRRSPQCLRPQRPPLVAGGRAPGRPASDPVRPHPARPRHRLHPGRLAAGQGPHRTPLAHPAGPPRRRAPAPRPPHPEAADAFLPAFLADFNRRFAHPAAHPTPAWRRPPADLATVLSCRYRRTVARDNTVRLGAAGPRLPRGAAGRSYAGVPSRRASALTVGCWSTARAACAWPCSRGRAPTSSSGPAAPRRPAGAPRLQRASTAPGLGAPPSGAPPLAPRPLAAAHGHAPWRQPYNHHLLEAKGLHVHTKTRG